MPLIEALRWARDLITAHGWLSIQKQRHTTRLLANNTPTVSSTKQLLLQVKSQFLVCLLGSRNFQRCLVQVNTLLLGFSCRRVDPNRIPCSSRWNVRRVRRSRGNIISNKCLSRLVIMLIKAHAIRGNSTSVRRKYFIFSRLGSSTGDPWCCCRGSIIIVWSQHLFLQKPLYLANLKSNIHLANCTL